MTVQGRRREVLVKLGEPPDHRLVDKTDVSVTRPALERAGCRCECCRHVEGLRVCVGRGQYVDHVVVLCAECRETGGLAEVVEHRHRGAAVERAARRAAAKTRPILHEGSEA